MKKEHFLLIIAAIIIVSALIMRLTSYKMKEVALPQAEDNEVVLPKIQDETVQPSIKEEPAPPQVNDVKASSSEVVLKIPMPGQVISSPLSVEGSARGNWFFEATLPVKLIDADGNLIAEHYAQARGDWMSMDLVEFSSLLEFNTTATSGYLIISKDNPSGLPEHDASVAFPVLFK